MKCECDKCNNIKTYSEALDTFYCKTCDEWKETKCSDPDCKFCMFLDKKPSEVVGVKRDYQLSLTFNNVHGELPKGWEEVIVFLAKEYQMEIKEIRHTPQILEKNKNEKVERKISLLFCISLEEKEKMENAIFDIAHETNSKIYGMAFNRVMNAS